jgi:hypothetical protein
MLPLSEDPEDKDRVFVQNVGIHLPDYVLIKNVILCIFPLSKLDEALMFLTCIGEVSGLNLSWYTDYFERGFL